jgi:alanine dehydrogenase
VPEYSGDFRAMPAYVKRLDKCALKWVNVHPNNRRFGLPSVMAVIVLSDPRNGLPLCIMAGGYPTSLRTGAAGGVAAKYLARKNSRVVGMVGCGAQARTQLQALLQLFKLKEVKVWGANPHEIKDFIRDMKKAKVKFTGIKEIEECVRGSDIIVTTTPSRKPLVKLEWLKAGAHINAIGADAKGKQELEHWILRKAKVVVDSWEQASHSGEINVPLSYGQITKNDIYTDIGQIVSGGRKGRTSAREITVFDSTGLAIQDAAIADLIFKAAIRKKVGTWVRLA